MVDSKLDSSAKVQGVETSCDGFASFCVDGSSKNSGSGSSVSGNVVRLGRDALDELSTHVFKLVFKIDGLGYCDTVFGDLGWSVRLLDDDIASLWAKGDL
jgi:hypothetical protein